MSGEQIGDKGKIRKEMMSPDRDRMTPCYVKLGKIVEDKMNCLSLEPSLTWRQITRRTLSHNGEQAHLNPLYRDIALKWSHSATLDENQEDKLGSHWSAVAYVIDSPNRCEESYVIHTQPTSADVRDSCRIDTSADIG